MRSGISVSMWLRVIRCFIQHQLLKTIRCGMNGPVIGAHFVQRLSNQWKPQIKIRNSKFNTGNNRTLLTGFRIGVLRVALIMRPRNDWKKIFISRPINISFSLKILQLKASGRKLSLKEKLSRYKFIFQHNSNY